VSGELAEVLRAMGTIRRILEPVGGAVEWEGQPAGSVREFLLAAANTQWLLGISVENIVGEVAIALPRRA